MVCGRGVGLSPRVDPDLPLVEKERLYGTATRDGDGGLWGCTHKDSTA